MIQPVKVPFSSRYRPVDCGSEQIDTLGFFYGTLRRRWPSLGLHAWVQEATFGKGRIIVGPADQLMGDGDY